MIYSLNGLIIDKQNDRVIIECSGVGYEVQMTRYGLSMLPDVNENVFLFIHMIVREDSVELFGFKDTDERDCYRILLSVSGIGPKGASAVLSELTPDELAAAVATGDTAMITRAQGVGPKVAQRIILELKDKIGALSSVPMTKAPVQKGGSAKTVEAIEALMTLGYTQHEAKRVVSKLDVANLSVEDIIKIALKEMM